MTVLGALSVTLEVPDVGPGVKFYTDAGLISNIDGNVARFRCQGQNRDSLILLGGAPRKRLHHITLMANHLDEMVSRVPGAGGKLVQSPDRSEDQGLWVTDPHGMLIHLCDCPADPELNVSSLFEINAPGRLVRKGRSAMLGSGRYPAVKPLRLGHILLFSPDVLKSVAFVTEALGMALADRVQDVLAFCCVRKDSDHHVVAFAKSSGCGFHHASFQVADPDEVGRGGKELRLKARRGDWGFGRHTIGSNFFHYIQDPWGSWIEYYSDIDHIDDYSRWVPTNYGLEDALANWGPEAPDDFVHNYEAESSRGFESVEESM